MNSVTVDLEKLQIVAAPETPTSSTLTSPASPTSTAPPRKTMKRCSTLRNSKSINLDMTPHMKTVEGFSSYVLGTSFGRIVNRMGRGQLLGELALIHDSNRAATAKVVQEVEVLIIGRVDFDQIFKEELKQVDQNKFAFLQEHVPGMKEAQCVRGKPHVAYNFRQASFTKGHAFLKQGTRTEESVYVVTKGAVLVGFREHVAPCGKVHKLSVLLPGGFFGSLPAFNAPEPFTVVALSGSVEVLYANSEDVYRMPPRLVDSMREYLAQSTIWRLQKLQQSRATEQETAAAAAKRDPVRSLKPKPVTSPKFKKLDIMHSLPHIGQCRSGTAKVKHKPHTNSEGRLPLVQPRTPSPPEPVRRAWD